MSDPVAKKGPRGLLPKDIVRGAIRVLERDGHEKFSVRRVAEEVGCDPMSVLYHFKSREGLERAMADVVNEKLKPVNPESDWRTQLENLAHQYRALALRFPETFPLLMRFWVTGPADFRHAEAIYRALEKTGLGRRDVVDVCFGWYAGVLGLAAAEIGGLLKPAPPEVLDEVKSLPESEFPATKRLLPEFARQKPGRVFERMLKVLLDGIASQVPPGRRG